MNVKVIKEWLNDIANPTGISYSGDQTISESMVEKIVDYVDELEQQCKKQKEVIDRIEKYIEKETRIYGLSMSKGLGIHFDNILGILKGGSNE